MKKLLLMSILLMVTLLQQVTAQNRSISGRVTDRTTGEGIPGVTVLVKGTTNGISTNADGGYTLTVPTSGATLQFSAIGFIAVEQPVGTANQVNVALAQDTRELSEVIVTGYGQQQERRDVTGSVVTIKAESFKDQPVIGVDQALQGRAAGVQVFQNSGTPGSGISVRVRGAASIGGSNEPLYVVDGLPINGGNSSQLGTGNQQVNALNDLNPNDIASIEVLKDAAAAAIYGSRASNGVVLITTKRGQAGKTKIDVDYYRGAQTVWKKPQIINGAQQTQLFLDQVSNRYPANADGTVTTNPGNSTTPPTIYRSYADLAAYTFGPGDRTRANGIYSYVDAGPIRPLSQFQDPSTATSTNWADQVLRTAPITNYGLNFSGGSEASRYRLSLGYFDQQGTVVGSGYNRMSVRLTVDNKVSDKVKMGVSLGLSSATNNRINNDNSIYGALTTARLTAADLPIYNADGTYYKSGSIENPVAAVREPFIKSVNNRLIATQYTEFEFIKHLKYRATFGLDYLYGRDDRFYSTLTNAGAAVRGDATAATLQEPNFNHFSAFTYNNTFGKDHSLTVLAVAEYQRDVQSTIFAEVTGFPSNAIQQLSAGATKTVATSSSTLNALFGVLGKVDYSFKSRYLFSATVRRDRSSRFGADNQVGYFPAASAGWRVIDESFLKEQQILSELKLRGSYGETGNQNFNNFGSRGLIGPGNNYLDQGGLSFSQLANPNLKWERTRSTDLGIDFAILQNRFYVSADVYKRKTDDLLLAQPIPANSGFTSYSANIGNLENKGLEINLNTVNVRGEKDAFNWETNFNISFNRNKVTALSTDTSPTGLASGFASRLKVGEPLGAFYGYRVDHIIQTQEEVNALNEAARAATGRATATYQTQGTRAGDIKFKDLNGDGVVNASDQEIIGNAQAKYYGGFSNTFRFKGFDLNALLQYNMGNQIYNAGKAFTQGMSTSYGQDVEVLNRWTPDNTNTDVPRAVFGDPNSNNRASDRFLENGSFARLKTVTLGYTLPASVMTRIHMRSARIYAQAQNLVTFTSYPGLDPEVSTFAGNNQALGTDFFTFPQARTITGGITLGF